MPNSTNILVIDGDAITRSGIARALDSMDEKIIIHESRTFDSVIWDDVDSDSFELIITAKNFANNDDLKYIKQFHTSCPDSSIIIFSSSKNPNFIVNCIFSGISGIIHPSSDLFVVQEIIREVLRGLVVFPKEIISDMTHDGCEVDYYPNANFIIGELTKRQNSVLNLLRKGKTNSQIASELGISENTVRVHLSAVLKVLKASNRTQAALIASAYFREQNND